jgi:hypothetical protein
VTVGTCRSWLSIGFAAVVVAVLAYAWIDGGREPLHEISQPVAVPQTEVGTSK